MPRIVHCAKINRDLPGLEAPPFAGPLGERIYNQISQQAWGLWPAQATLIINHYGLNLADPQAQKTLMQAMEEFFFGAGAQMPEGWSPQAPPTKGGGPQPTKGGAPQRK